MVYFAISVHYTEFYYINETPVYRVKLVGYLKASLCLESNHRAYVIVKGHETSTRQYQVLMLCILLEDKSI